jgi:hypothetical protein
LKSGTRGFVTLVSAALLVVACKSNPASPGTTQTVSQFVSSVMTAAGGATAVQENGAPPAANGGPSITVTGSSTVTDGGLAVVNIQGSAPFQTVFVSISGAGSAVGGFYQLQLPTATTSTDVVQGLSATIPVSSFQAVYSVAAPSGPVGASASMNTSVQATGPTVSVTGTWSGSVSLSQTKPLTMILTQTGAQVTGSFSVGGQNPISGSLFGSVAGTTLTFASAQFLNVDGCTQQINNVTLQVSGTTMQGTGALGGVSGSCPATDSGTLTFTLTKS